MAGFSGARSGGAAVQEKKTAAVKKAAEKTRAPGAEKSFMPLLSVLYPRTIREDDGKFVRQPGRLSYNPAKIFIPRIFC
jgi:hypothetical protein